VLAPTGSNRLPRFLSESAGQPQPPVEWFAGGIIDRQRKLNGYLLSPSHPDGRDKLRLWHSVFGIGEGDAELLERLIREQLVQAQPKEQEGKTPPEGLPEVIRRWELVIPRFRGPNGNVGPVLTARALDPDVGEASPHLVTAFPLL
jgi:hypothetical protein